MRLRKTVYVNFSPEELGQAFMNMPTNMQIHFLAGAWREVEKWDGGESTITKLERQLRGLLRDAENDSPEATEFLAVMRGVLKEMR